MLIDVFQQSTVGAVGMETSQPREQFPLEDVVGPLDMRPTIKENGVPSLIADALLRRIVNEKGVLRVNRAALSASRKKPFRKNFHIKDFRAALISCSAREIYYPASLLT